MVPMTVPIIRKTTQTGATWNSLEIIESAGTRSGPIDFTINVPIVLTQSRPNTTQVIVSPTNVVAADESQPIMMVQLPSTCNGVRKARIPSSDGSAKARIARRPGGELVTSSVSICVSLSISCGTWLMRLPFLSGKTTDEK